MKFGLKLCNFASLRVLLPDVHWNGLEEWEVYCFLIFTMVSILEI